MMSLDWEATSVDFLPGGQKVVVLLFQVSNLSRVFFLLSLSLLYSLLLFLFIT